MTHRTILSVFGHIDSTIFITNNKQKSKFVSHLEDSESLSLFFIFVFFLNNYIH